MDTYSSDPLILILDRDNRALVSTCHGPDAFGTCPRAAEGEVVPCAGRRLVPAGGTGLEGWRVSVVDADLDTCPLAWAIPGRVTARGPSSGPLVPPESVPRASGSRDEQRRGWGCGRRSSGPLPIITNQPGERQ